MKHEVFIFGQRIDHGRAIRDGREAREIRKGKRERIEKGSRERIEKKVRDKKPILKEGGPEPFLQYSRSTLRCSHCFFKSLGYYKLKLKHQNCLLQGYRMHY